MILQRLATSIRKQDWFTVLIETLIVVFGVFIGLQVNNWNEARADGVAYDEALIRFEAEIERNAAELERVIADLAISLPRAEAAIETLQACNDADGAKALIDEAMRSARGTASIRMRRASLDALTSDPILLSQQTSAERQRFSDLAFMFDLFEVEADWAEFHPLDIPIENVPVLGIGTPLPPRETEYAGRTYQWNKSYPLVLAAPLSEACEQGDLIKALFSWHRWQNNLTPLSVGVLEELKATKTLLEERR
ncbi:hypothetical protein WNY37_16920 [Henriciella sp. AS95]|uniref:hypothetical protein n=1 Tax=Henriciella sp. AS95 TaxID=3135782 RepID=UPI00316C303A